MPNANDFTDELRLLGAWWQPGAPGDSVEGTLTLRDGRGQLELLGSFADTRETLRRMIGQGPPIPCLHGAAQGKAVSLFDVRSVGGTMSMPGVAGTRYHAGAVLLGGHVGADGAPMFRRSRFRFDALDGWAGLDGFAVRSVTEEDGARVGGFDLSYRDRPDVLLADVGVRVTLETAGFHSRPTMWEHHLRQWCYLVCDHRTPVPLDRVINGTLHDLYGVLTLLTGRSVRTERMEVEIDVRGHHVWAELHMSLVANEPRDAVPDVDAMLLPLPLLGEGARAVFEAWFTQREQLDSVLNLFAATESTPGLYLEAEFLFRAQAIESLHRRTDAVQLLSADEFAPLRDRLLEVIADAGFARPVREALSNKLRHLHEVSLRRRLKLLIARVREPVSEVFAPDNHFVEAVVDTRNYLTHYDTDAAARALSGVPLFLLTRKLRVLLQVALLSQLGLSTDLLREICRRRKCFADVRYAIRTNGGTT